MSTHKNMKTINIIFLDNFKASLSELNAINPRSLANFFKCDTFKISVF